MRVRKAIAIACAIGMLALPAAAQADFGFIPGSLSAAAKNKDGTITTQASAHPYIYVVKFKLKTDESGHVQGGEPRDFVVDLPPGLVGNPLAVPRCPRQLFEGFIPQCPPNTQVGVLRVVIPSLGPVLGPVYNMVAPPGVAGQLGFSAANYNALQNVSVRSEEGYGLRATTNSVPIELTSVTAEIWGLPADPSHDAERGQAAAEGQGPPVPSGAPLLPLLTMPANCDAPLQITAKADSKLAPGIFAEESALSLDGGGNPAPLAGCDAVPFSPKVSSTPTTHLTSNPSGLDFELKLPNQGLLSPGGIAETEPRKTVVTLPQGVTVNPSLAEGISVCTEAQFKAEQADSPVGAGCPEASKLGSLVAKTPLAEEQVEGSMYLAAPYENPFGTLTALYLVARAPERGLIVKQAGRVDLDPSTGQITTTFEGLPPIPYSSFKLHFREGARAPLATPQACGEYQTRSELTPFSSDQPLTLLSNMTIDRGPEGGSCPTAGLPPFRPGLIAGALNNAAGRFSPFNVRLFRSDAEQEINRFSIKLPPGVVGKLAGIPFCPDQAIEAAKARTGIHGGQEEIDSPSCPKASQIGRTLSGAGVGQALAYAPGKIYLAGPYHGSAISLVAITAAKVGPFDLGTVVIRQAFKVDPETGEVFIDATGSDPIPHIINGVPTHLRDIRAYTDRPQFVLNPTDCTRTSTASTLLGSGLDFDSEADNNPVTVSTPFQAADCAGLPFKPRFSLSLLGKKTNRGAHPALRATLRMGGIGEAGIGRAQVTLPGSEFIENEHFETICTRVQFKEGATPGERCPAGSIYGHAKATTPILTEALEGPVFLRSNPERKLPDVLIALHNQEIDVDLVGHTDSVKGKLRTTFEGVPDAPVSSFEVSLAGGKKGLFVNQESLCLAAHRAIVSFVGQNGKRADSTPKVKTGCKGSKPRKGKRAKRRGR